MKNRQDLNAATFILIDDAIIPEHDFANTLEADLLNYPTGLRMVAKPTYRLS